MWLFFSLSSWESHLTSPSNSSTEGTASRIHCRQIPPKRPQWKNCHPPDPSRIRPSFNAESARRYLVCSDFWIGTWSATVTQSDTYAPFAAKASTTHLIWKDILEPTLVSSQTSLKFSQQWFVSFCFKGVRPYKCNLCEKSFTQRCSLESHCLKVHGVAHQYDYKQRRSKVNQEPHLPFINRN